MDRDVHARREAAVLVGIAVDGELEEVGTDAAIVQERVALARRAIAADGLAVALRLDQERQELALGALDLLGKGGIGLEIAETLSCARAASRSATAPGRRPGSTGMGEIDPEGAAMGRQLVDVDQL